MTLRITQYGEDILHEKGQKVSDFSDELAKLTDDMTEAMRHAEGIGLAAQQIGQALRFCVVEVPDHPDYPISCILDGKSLSPSLLMPMPLANPKIEFLPGDEFYYEEGCLSLPGIKGDVARPELIRVEYQDLDGVPHVLECDGLLARCIQHEVDHLDGILFIDRMEKAHFAEIRDEVRALRKKTQSTIKEGKLPCAYPE
ncbi:MAG: peptide deformylase [Opitutae bacterium]|nr:peptide deformylase [Opitutae bacterium]|tara:strand:+ start:942 stop:1538 length:597 start_codon:yes stop_codon:yes gene_type:complete